jgi:fibronectin type 3 domain-containing protein
VAGEGVISLIWEGVEAADLAGYIVLRGDAPSGDLAPLFDTPLRESTYRDTSAKPGVRYVYAVVAVDRTTPPNRSPISNTVEETAR